VSSLAEHASLTELTLLMPGSPPLELPRMFAALAHNTHLRSLAAWGLKPSTALLRDVVLPAVRANVGLRELKIELSAELRSATWGCPVARDALHEAQQLVAARAARHARLLLPARRQRTEL
jgi:hypothetical protein